MNKFIPIQSGLQNKVALVTGGSKNLGKAVVLYLAKQNIKVTVHYNSSEAQAKTTLKEVKKTTDGIIVKADLTNPKAVSTMFKKIEKDLGHVDILINLVGNFIFKPITKTSFEKFRDVIESNLYASFLCSQKVLPGMVKKKWGRIINFGCVAADTITIRKNTTPYYIAKTGVIMLTKVLAYEYAKHGITVNSISPGILETSIAKPPTPGGKFAQFSDIVNAINFLLKEESSYINGANIEVAGGWTPGFSS